MSSPPYPTLDSLSIILSEAAIEHHRSSDERLLVRGKFSDFYIKVHPSDWLITIESYWPDQSYIISFDDLVNFSDRDPDFPFAPFLDPETNRLFEPETLSPGAYCYVSSPKPDRDLFLTAFRSFSKSFTLAIQEAQRAKGITPKAD